jgi:hypothetical protein
MASLDSASIVETVQGHEENQSVWTMCMTPDRVNCAEILIEDFHRFFVFSKDF